MIAQTLTCAAALALSAAPALAQPLSALRPGGDLVRIFPGGATYLIQSTGLQCNAIATYSTPSGRGGHASMTLLAGGPGVQADQLLFPTGGVFLTTTGRPAGHGVRALLPATGYNPTYLYALLSTADPSTPDLLARIDLSSGAYLSITSTGAADLEALALSPSGGLYALGTSGGGTLYVLTPTAQPIGSGGFGDSTALGFRADGTLLAAGSNLYFVNPATGATTLVGPLGSPGLRGLAVLNFCYPNCTDGPPPILNVADFTCFLQWFAFGTTLPPDQQVLSYANCDESITPPALNVADFTCFLQKFAAGCTSP